MAQEQGGLVGDSVLAVNLMGADALLRRTHIEYRGEPDRQGNVRPFKDGSDRDRELSLAGLAAVDGADLVLGFGLASDLVRCLYDSAMRAYFTVRPTLSL